MTLSNPHKPNWLIEQEVTVAGQPVLYSYDKEGDILEIFFHKGRGGVGIDLTDNIVLRYDRESQEPLSLIFLSFSRLIQETEFGPPSFRLIGFEHLPPDMQRVVFEILHSPPVNQFLKVSGLLIAPDKKLQPITYLEQPVELQLDKMLD